MNPTPPSAASNNVWPVARFSFQVSWGSQVKIPFQEVCGLNTETQVIEYRHSNSPAYSTIKMPGIKKYGNVTLKKGTFVTTNAFWTWYSQIQMNTMARSTVVIQLLDERAQPAMTWTLTNAWPTKISTADLKSDGNEVAIQTIELAHEGLTISNT